MVAQAHFQVKMLKAPHVRTTFGRSDIVSRGRRKGFCTLSKASKKRQGFVAVSKALAGMGHLRRICKEAFSAASAVQETWSAEMLAGQSQSADFLRELHFEASDLQVC